MKFSKPPYQISDRTANIILWTGIILAPLFYMYMLTGWGDDIYHTLARWGAMSFCMVINIHIINYYQKRGWDVFSLKNFHDASRTMITAMSCAIPIIIASLVW